MLQDIIRRLNNIKSNNKQTQWNKEWLKVVTVMKTGTADEITALKASKIRTYAKLHHDKTYRVGMTKQEMAQDIIANREEG